MQIEFDELLNKYVVWLKDKNIYEEVYSGTKKDCERYVRTQKKGIKKNEKRNSKTKNIK